jgi:hypothetical protein
MRSCIIFLLITIILVPTVLHSQPPEKPKGSEGGAEGDASKDYRERLDRLIRSKTGPESAAQNRTLTPAKPEDVKPIVPSPPDLAGLDPRTKERYQAALQRYYEYLFSGFEHRQRVFGWQLLSSKIIFVVVLVLVFVGIYFAAVQFHMALRQKTKEEPTEIEASLKGIKVSSSVLGVIILVISLAFFYLYLAYVYPITEIF